MKYIIRESQYKRLIEQEERFEFPGIEYFNGDWDVISHALNNMTLYGEVYSDINEFKKAYYIKGIQEFVTQDNNLNNAPEGNDYGINLNDLTNGYQINYEGAPNAVITIFYLDEVFVEIYDDSEDQYPFKEDYVEYEDLDIKTIEEIYKMLALNFG